MVVPLVQKKTLRKLNAGANETVASKPSGFGLEFLKKHGWKEGEGLGKKGQGRSSYVRVVKKDDKKGIGCSQPEREFSEGQWWNNAFSSAAKKLRAVSKRLEESSDDSSDSDSSDDEANVSLQRDMATYTPEDVALFKACGGRRCGKRAGALQVGKMLREQRADEAFRLSLNKIVKSKSISAKEALIEASQKSSLLKADSKKVKLSKSKRKAKDAKAVKSKKRKSQVKSEKKRKKKKKSKS